MPVVFPEPLGGTRCHPGGWGSLSPSCPRRDQLRREVPRKLWLGSTIHRGHIVEERHRQAWKKNSMKEQFSWPPKRAASWLLKSFVIAAEHDLEAI